MVEKRLTGHSATRKRRDECMYTCRAQPGGIGGDVAVKSLHQIYPKQSNPCHCLNIRRASRAVSEFYENYLEPCALTIAQLSLLWQVSAAERITIHELAQRMRIDRTTLNRNMKPLEHAGLITIRPCSDPRTRQVRLTEAGGKAVTHGRELWAEAQGALQEYLGETDLATLGALLCKLEALVP